MVALSVRVYSYPFCHVSACQEELNDIPNIQDNIIRQIDARLKQKKIAYNQIIIINGYVLHDQSLKMLNLEINAINVIHMHT